MARSLECPLVTASVTRLLVDLNRSPTNPAVFSTITRRLSVDERVLILNRYHQPHRGRVEDILAEALLDRGRVLHVSVHSFTPALNGSPRTADIGLLYDPRRPGERRFAAAWKFALKSATSDLRIRCNYPYLGRSDGLTTHLRGRLDRRRYLGLELEVNQSWVARESARWRDFQMVLIESLRAVLHR
jgi:predicted N-formylglutamate amidohydrolase